MLSKASQIRRSPSWETVEFDKSTAMANENKKVGVQRKRAVHEHMLALLLTEQVVEKVLTFFLSERNATLILLVLIGLISCVNAFAIDIAIASLGKWKVALCQSADFPGPFLIYFLIAVASGTCAAFIVKRYARAASGSGLPEMKSILSGVRLRGFFDWTTLVVKIFTLLLVVAGAGLELGVLGPFVYVCAVLCHKLLQNTAFARVNANRSLRNEILDAACAAGVSSVFSAPVGGVLFSIETTATFYLVSNLWKSLVASTVGAVGSFLLRYMYNGAIWKLETNLPYRPYSGGELPLFALVGLLCGLASVVIIKCYKRVWRYFRTLRPVVVLFFVSGLTAAVTYWSPLMRFKTLTTLIVNFFTLDTLTHDTIGVFADLSIFTAAIGIMVVLAISSPIPGGLFMPDICLGAALGRLVGEVVRAYFNPAVFPQTYAIVGGAALVSGMTASLSSSVILFEATGEISLLIPVLVGVICARGVSSLFERSIYDVIIDLKRIPVIRRMTEHRVAVASDIMVPLSQLNVLAIDSPMQVVGDVVGDPRQLHAAYPVVRSHDEPILVGTVDRADLEHLFQVVLELPHADLLMSEVPEYVTRATVPFSFIHPEYLSAAVPGAAGPRAGQSQSAVAAAAISCAGSPSAGSGSSVAPPAIEMSSLGGSDTGSQPWSQDVESSAGLSSVSMSSNSEEEGRSIVSAVRSHQHHVVHDNVVELRTPDAIFALPLDTSFPLVDINAKSDYIYEMFSMLDVSHIYVVSLGRLTGLITRRQLMTLTTPIF